MFDPYRDWLGLTDDRRPPTLYQLLGIQAGESDPQVIESAVGGQLAKVQAHLAGANSKDAWRMIDEITLAKTTLLDPVRRSAYNSVFGIKTASAAAPPVNPAWYQSTPAPPPPDNPAWYQSPPAPPPVSAAWYQDSPASPPVPAPIPAPPAAPTWSPPVAAWPQPQVAPPSAAPGFFQPPSAPPPVPVPVPANTWQQPPAAPVPVAYRPPDSSSPAPVALVATAFSPSESAAAPTAAGLPEAAPIPKPMRSGIRVPIMIGGGVLALFLVIAVAYFATRDDDATVDSTDKKTEVASNSPSPKNSLPSSRQDAPRQDAPPKELPKKLIPPKKVVAKPPPKNELPPRVNIDDEFKQAKIYRGHTATPRGLAVSVDGKQLITAGSDFAVNSWVPSTDKPSRRKTLAGPEPPVGVGFLHDGKDAVVADTGAVFILNLATNSDIRKMTPSGGSLTSLTVAPDGNHILTGSTDGMLRWWDAGKDTVEKTIDASEGIPIECVALTPDGKVAVAGNLKNGMVSVWTVPGAVQIKKWKAHATDVTAVACSPDGKRLVTTGDDQLVKVWDLFSGTLLLTIKGHEDVPLAAKYSVDGSMIITAGIDMTVRYWDAVTGDPLRGTFKAEQKIYSLALDPKDRFLIAGLGDGGIQMLFLPAVRPDSPPKAAWVQTPPKPLPLPLASSVASAAKALRERYANDFAQTDPEERAALFEKLMTRAKVAPDEPNVRLALFQEARNVAVKLGKMDDALKAIETRAKWFDADDLEDKSQALKVAAQGVVDKGVVEVAVAVIEDAEKQIRLDIIDELFRLNELFPQLENAPELTTRIQAAKKRWSDAAADREASRKLATELAKEPDNAKLNLQYGQYLCFRVGEWNDGLAYLVKTDDAALKDLVKKDQADPKDGKGQIELGRTWAEYAAKADDPHKAGILVRAKQWYEKGINSLPAAERLAAAQQLSKVSKQIADLGAIALARPGEPVIRKSFNSIRSNVAVENQWILIGSDGYTDEGLALKSDASLTSRFKLLDQGRVEFSVVFDGRSIKLSVYGINHEFKPEATPTLLSVERRGDEIVFVLKAPTGTVLEEKFHKLMAAKQAPTAVILSAAGPAQGDGIKIKSIVINGPVKPTE